MYTLTFRDEIANCRNAGSGNQSLGLWPGFRPGRAVPRLRWWLAGLLLSLGVGQRSYAQDLILRTDGTRIEARVLKVSGHEIFYQPWAETATLTTVLDASVVAAIRYANGVEYTFPRPANPTVLAAGFNTLHQSIVLGIRVSDLRFNNLTFTYEWLPGQGKLGVKVPFTLGLSRSKWDCYHESSTYYQSNKIFSTGLEFNVYSDPQKRLRFFGGPAFQYGRFHYPYITPVPYTYTYTILFFFPSTVTASPNEVKVGEQFAALGQAGVAYRLTKSLLIGADAGVGFQLIEIDRHNRYQYSDQLSDSQLLFSGNVNIGFTF